MPYITKDTRAYVEAHGARNVGELTYEITKILVNYQFNYGLSFSCIAVIRGALVSALDEYNRRVAHPYEDAKCEQNGDVYDVG